MGKSDSGAALCSVVVPCYNVEAYLPKFLESLILQNYRPLQVVLVDDGSTDATADILRAFQVTHCGPGFDVEIVSQRNRGLAGAINAGLGRVRGEFLIWPDPDDWLAADSIAARMSIMTHHADCALLRTNVDIFDQQSGCCVGPYLKGAEGVVERSGLFGDIIRRKTFTAPVMHMVRTDVLWRAYPDRRIFESRRASQNFQILLPVIARGKVYESSKVMGVYRRRGDSRSHMARSGRQKILRNETIYEVLKETIRNTKLMSCNERLQWQRFYFGAFLAGDYAFEAAPWRFLKMARKAGVPLLPRSLAVAIVALALVLRLPGGKGLRRMLSRRVRAIVQCDCPAPILAM